MSGLSSADAHESCAAKSCVVLSGLVGDSQPAPQRAARAESATADLLASFGLVAQLKPYLPLFTPDGIHIEPDVGFHLGTGTSAQRSRGELLDVAVEVRVQEEAGTVAQKNEATIRRYARVWDEHGLGTIMLHVLCPQSVGQAYIDEVEVFAHLNLVGFLPIHGLTLDRLRTELTEITDRRDVLASGMLPEALTRKYPADVLAYATRVAERRLAEHRQAVRP